ncbi:hypothetical protein FJT64_024559 [Amphibalanus amphitrite]|uniref:Uncharacterized protein n=1 Tax=Amphibalanus amphitrite TaxID=1232801 RepID=A0A6A4WLC8_AMPAM|nr:hypothetical protein FJT64_024559 [Amphibalanus amphitrite]
MKFIGSLRFRGVYRRAPRVVDVRELYYLAAEYHYCPECSGTFISTDPRLVDQLADGLRGRSLRFRGVYRRAPQVVDVRDLYHLAAEYHYCPECSGTFISTDPRLVDQLADGLRGRYPDITKKLAGLAANSTYWATSFANGRREVLNIVLTTSEGLDDLEPLTTGLTKTNIALLRGHEARTSPELWKAVVDKRRGDPVARNCGKLVTRLWLIKPPEREGESMLSVIGEMFGEHRQLDRWNDAAASVRRSLPLRERDWLNDTDLDKFTHRWVVPFNPFLLRAMKAHVNVEVISHSTSCVKYAVKYVQKGSDQPTYTVVTSEEGELDEVAIYQHCRYLGSMEASWRLLDLPIHEHHPTVEQLDLHLSDDDRRLQFRNDANLEAVLQNQRASKLTAFFQLCAADEFARTLLYTEENWFFLRLLLMRVPGPTSFLDLRTVDGEVLPTMQQACSARGLLEDGEHWDPALAEATTSGYPNRLRLLFAIILTEGGATCDPVRLWAAHQPAMSEDITHRQELLRAAGRPCMSAEEIQHETLRRVGLCLQLGNGELPIVRELGEDVIDVPPESRSPATSVAELAVRIFPDLAANYVDTEWLHQRAILTPRNSDVDKVNQVLMEMLPGATAEYRSIDSMTDPEAVPMPTEVLNSLELSGLPSHRLTLKVGPPVILMRNIDAPRTVNGTLCTVSRLHANVLELRVVGELYEAGDKKPLQLNSALLHRGISGHSMKQLNNFLTKLKKIV